jgi:hypothetical protein
MMEKVTLFCMIAVLSSLKMPFVLRGKLAEGRVYWKSQNVTKCGPVWHTPILLGDYPLTQVYGILG